MRKSILRIFRALVPLLAISTAAAAEPNTVVSEKTFRLTLPGKWSGGYDAASGSWAYKTASRESVTVGILERTSGPDMAEVKKDFGVYLNVRRKQELALGGLKVKLGDPVIREVPGAMLARYWGYDPGRDRRSETFIVVNERAAGSYYYEALGMSEAAFKARAGEVLAHVGLVK
jgi:hypothetical protein